MAARARLVLDLVMNVFNVRFQVLSAAGYMGTVLLTEKTHLLRHVDALHVAFQIRN
jgi:hypothetical protein